MRNLITYLLLALVASGWSQAPARYKTTYGGFGNDYGNCVRQIYNRQYVIAGSSTSGQTNSSDFYLLRIDSMGQAIWQRTYGTQAAEAAKSVLFYPQDSGFIMVGYGNNGSAGYDLMMMRTDKSGEVKWTKYFGTDDWDFGNDAVLYDDTTMVVCGETVTENGDLNGLLVRVDVRNGNIIWSRSVGGVADDSFVSICKLRAGNCVAAGTTVSYSNSKDIWLYKFNVNGDSLFSNKYGLSSIDETCTDILEDKSNNIFLCGSRDVDTTSAVKSRALYVCLNSNYLQTYEHMETNGGDADKFLSCTERASIDRYFLTRSVWFGPSGIEGHCMIFDYQFNYQAATTFGFEQTDYLVHCDTASDGFIMVGSTVRLDQYNTDVFFVKVDSTIYQVPLILSDDAKESNEDAKVFYYGGMIFLGDYYGPTAFEIIDLFGISVQRGITDQNVILLDKKLHNGLYTLVYHSADRKPRVLKFLRHE